MAIKVIRKIALTASVVFAAGGVLLIGISIGAADEAAALGSIALLCAAAAAYIGGVLPRPDFAGDVFERIAWGKLFVVATYAAIALAMFVAMTLAPDYHRLLHIVL